MLYLVFTRSGLTGMVYEATWTRYLAALLGHAAYGQVLVLSLYMGGIGGGGCSRTACVAHPVAPLVGYAAIEAVLGVAALGSARLFDGVTAYAYG